MEGAKKKILFLQLASWVKYADGFGWEALKSDKV